MKVVTYVSDPLTNFKNGDITVVLGHSESWLSSTAQDITTCLNQKGLIVGTFLDGFQMNLANHWGSDFRLVWCIDIVNLNLVSK